MYSTRDFPFKRVKVTKDAKKCFMVVDKYTGLDPQDQEDEFEELLKNMHKHTR